MKFWSKLPRITKGGAIGILVGITALTIAVTWTINSASTRNQLAANKKSTSQVPFKLKSNGEPLKDQPAIASQKSSTNATQPTAQSTLASTSEVKPAIKYATSSDPRSTAYSTTPPPANPDSFSIDITHAGQVAAGTLISYNATKGDKTYYGGDLVLSFYTMNVSKSDSSTFHKDLIISSPDGAVISMANFPYNKSQQYFAVARDSSLPVAQQTGTSVPMFIDAFDPPVGTYYLQIQDGRADTSGADGWTYYGFITVNVTD